MIKVKRNVSHRVDELCKVRIEWQKNDCTISKNTCVISEWTMTMVRVWRNILTTGRKCGVHLSRLISLWIHLEWWTVCRKYPAPAVVSGLWKVQDKGMVPLWRSKDKSLCAVGPCSGGMWPVVLCLRGIVRCSTSQSFSTKVWWGQLGEWYKGKPNNSKLFGPCKAVWYCKAAW